MAKAGTPNHILLDVLSRQDHWEKLGRPLKEMGQTLLTEKQSAETGRLYARKNILFFFQAGWDCWKAMWRCNQLDKALCHIMMDNYWKAINTTIYSKFMYKFMQKLSAAQQQFRLLKSIGKINSLLFFLYNPSGPQRLIK